jgi:hypothetical protein
MLYILTFMPSFRYRSICSILLTLPFLYQLSGTGGCFDVPIRRQVQGRRYGKREVLKFQGPELGNDYGVES